MTLAVASTVAFPVIVAFVLSLSYNYLMTLPGSAELRLTHGVPVAGIRPDVPHDSDLYAMRFPDHEASPLVERMSHAMTRFLGLPELKPGSQEATNVDPRIYEQHRDALWLEMSLNVISFESLDRFHLTLSSLKFNSPSLIVPLVQFLFGIFYPLLFWGVVLLLGRSVLRFTRRRFSGSAA
jgi:hypothetical protein